MPARLHRQAPARPRAGGLAAALAALLAAAACGQTPSQPRLLLLVSVDTLRVDRLGAYGSSLGLTPHLDRLARDSQRFTAAYAPSPFTLPSICALMTGRYPDELGVWSNGSRLPDGAPTLAEALRARGWRTAAVVSNAVLGERSGLERGFDLYDAELPQKEAVRGWPERIARDTTDAALAALHRFEPTASAPLFLWVHYQDPHGPYTAPGGGERYLEAERRAPDGRRELELLSSNDGFGGLPFYQALEEQREVAFYRASYDAEIAFTDRELGRLLDALEARGLTDSSVIVFTADHGESLGEDDYWFAHGALLSDPLIRVPLLLRRPGAAPGARGDVVALVDLHPTLIQLLLHQDTGPSPAGRDLLAAGAPDRSSSVYLHTLAAAAVPRMGVVAGDHKLVATLRGGAWLTRLSLRGDDAVDRTDLDPELANALRLRLAERDRLARRRRLPGLPTLSSGDREHLRGLGYAVPGELPRLPALEPLPDSGFDVSR